MVHIEMVRMYTPKKVKWNSLSELRDFLAKETTEKIVVFDGWRLITETTMYTMCDSKLFIDKPIKEKKVENKFEDAKQLLATKEDIARLDVKIAETKAELIKWMFIFWVGQIAVMAGILAYFFNVKN